MSATLLTHAFIQWAVYDGPEHLPAEVELGESYDHSTVQARIYHDRCRDVVGCGVQGTNRDPNFWADWFRNLDIRERVVRGHVLANGWYEGARHLAEWCAERGVVEYTGHSKGAAEAIDAAWEQEHLQGLVEGAVEVVAFASPKPFKGAVPRLRTLVIRNPDDFVCRLPPGPHWNVPGTQLVLPWEAPDISEDHRIDKLVAALRESFVGHMVVPSPGQAPPVVSDSRGAAKAHDLGIGMSAEVAG